MAGETISTNMGMPIPGVGSTAAPTWASDLNASLTIIDAHDHTNGNGVAITPSGMNINADLPFNGKSLNTVKELGFTSQSSPLAGSNFLSFSGGNLYVNDGSSNSIKITSAGSINLTPTSIPGLVAPASATYTAASKTFTWSSGAGTCGAAMDNGAVTIRETNVASAKGITLASPSSLAADYQVTLFSALPASTQYVSVGSTGNLGSSTADTIVTAATPSLTWVPTFTPSSGAITVPFGTFNYWKSGNLIFYRMFCSFDVTSGTPTRIIFTLPVESTGGGFFIIGNGFLSGTPAEAYLHVVNNDDDINGYFNKLTGSFSGAGNVINVQGFYEIS